MDLTEVGEVLQEFATAVQAMRDKLRTADLFSAIENQLPNDVFSVSTVARTTAALPSKVSEVSKKNACTEREALENLHISAG